METSGGENNRKFCHCRSATIREWTDERALHVIEHDDALWVGARGVARRGAALQLQGAELMLAAPLLLGEPSEEWVQACR